MSECEQLLAAVHAARYEYESTRARYALTFIDAMEPNVDGRVAFARTTAASREIRDALDRYKLALDEFAAYVFPRP